MNNSPAPVWTKIAIDESTWPEDDAEVLLCFSEGDLMHCVFERPTKTFTYFDEAGYISISQCIAAKVWWRSLCDLDRPPMTENTK